MAHGRAARHAATFLGNRDRVVNPVPSLNQCVPPACVVNKAPSKSRRVLGVPIGGARIIQTLAMHHSSVFQKRSQTPTRKEAHRPGDKLEKGSILLTGPIEQARSWNNSAQNSQKIARTSDSGE